HIIDRFIDRFALDGDELLRDSFDAILTGSPSLAALALMVDRAYRRAKESADQRDFLPAIRWSEVGHGAALQTGDESAIKRMSQLQKNIQALGPAPNRKILLSGAVNGALVTAVLDCEEESYQLEVDRQFDCRRSWSLALEFTEPKASSGRRDIAYCRSGLGRGPILVRIEGDHIEARIQDSRSQKNQSLIATLPTKSETWISIVFQYDQESDELRLFIGGELKQRAIAVVTPIANQLPLVMGVGVESDVAVPFRGKVRAISLGNVNTPTSR
ncbi:MAG TPA: hypothetical protein VHV77_03240, partial [Pirellulales bacterium]|nr:hypothetical protein [Pirellulales bacterium]